MNQADATCTGTVYHRTVKGQALAGKLDKLPVDQDFRRLLLMVNGFTPLNAIAGMAHFAQHAQVIAMQLEAKGLIERALPREGMSGSARELFWHHCMPLSS